MKKRKEKAHFVFELFVLQLQLQNPLLAFQKFLVGSQPAEVSRELLKLKKKQREREKRGRAKKANTEPEGQRKSAGVYRIQRVRKQFRGVTLAS